MIKHRSLVVTPDYLVDAFIVYVLKLTDLVRPSIVNDPLAVHCRRAHSDPMNMEIVGFDRPLTAVEIADLLDAEGYRPADYGELRGYWHDNISADVVVIIPSKEDLASDVCFCTADGGRLALVVTKPPDEDEAFFATTSLEGQLSPEMRFLVTKK